MILKAVYLLALLGAASAELPERRICEREPSRQRPTVCSNYKNLEHLDRIQTNLKDKKGILQERVDALESSTGLQFASANSSIAALERLVTNLSRTLEDNQATRLKEESRFRDVEARLVEHTADIGSMKRELRELVKHKERVGGNFSEIEGRLDLTERQLMDKKAKLDVLETETEAAFNDTQRLLDRYKSELSQLNVTSQELEKRVDARLDTTKAELQAELQEIQNNSEAFGAKLKEQKAKINTLIEGTERKFGDVGEQLTTRDTREEQLRAELEALKNVTAAITDRLESTEEIVDEQKELKLEVDLLKAEVSAKVAFTATTSQSRYVSTGAGRTIIFNEVLTNVGQAYDSQTGVFTAPIRGVYHFSFMTFGSNSYSSGAILMKNDGVQVSPREFRRASYSDSTSNTVILQLNAEDRLKVVLQECRRIHMSVFSGFLIHPTS